MLEQYLCKHENHTVDTEYNYVTVDPKIEYVTSDAYKEHAEACAQIVHMYDEFANVDITKSDKQSWARKWKELSPHIDQQSCILDGGPLGPDLKAFACSISDVFSRHSNQIARHAFAYNAHLNGIDEHELCSPAVIDEYTYFVSNAEKAIHVLANSMRERYCLQPDKEDVTKKHESPIDRIKAYWTLGRVMTLIGIIVSISLFVACVAYIGTKFKKNSNANNNAEASGAT